MPCPLCNENAREGRDGARATTYVECPVCGYYEISDRARDQIARAPSLAAKFASWVFSNSRAGVETKIFEDAVAWMKTYPRPSTRHRAELYLAEVIHLLGAKLTGRFQLANPLLRVASWSETTDDSVALAKYLASLGAVEGTAGPQEMFLLVRGHILFEEMQATRSQSSQVFVAMRFSDAMRPAYDGGLALGIREAGFTPLRIDSADHAGKIDDEIVAQIRLSAFMVADFTEHRGGVYYEAGFAHGLGQRVIFTCREDDIQNLHFDVRQYNTIPWTVPADLVTPLRNRIVAIYGQGPVRPA